MKMTEGKIKSPTCDCCGKKEFKRKLLDCGSIKDGKLSEVNERKKLCKDCTKAVKDSIEPIGYFTDMSSRKIYPADKLKYIGIVERFITDRLSKESKEFIRSFHKNKVFRLFFDEYSLEPFVKWIETIENKLNSQNTEGKKE